MRFFLHFICIDIDTSHRNRTTTIIYISLYKNNLFVCACGRVDVPTHRKVMKLFYTRYTWPWLSATNKQNFCSLNFSYSSVFVSVSRSCSCSDIGIGLLENTKLMWTQWFVCNAGWNRRMGFLSITESGVDFRCWLHVWINTHCFTIDRQ